jgi:hypothetical protein
LPARVARYDRKWGPWASPMRREKQKPPNRKVYFGRERRLFHSPSRHLAYTMPPKASFRVNLPPKQQENVPLHPPTTTSFALPGTLAERKLQRKSQREANFNGLNVQKARLSEWDLNVPSTSAPPSQSATTIAYGMPTPRTPLRLLDVDPMEAEAYMEKEDYGSWEEIFQS